jgi:hypothetical protein
VSLLDDVEFETLDRVCAALRSGNWLWYLIFALAPSVNRVRNVVRRR